MNGKTINVHYKLKISVIIYIQAAPITYNERNNNIHNKRTWASAHTPTHMYIYR